MTKEKEFVFNAIRLKEKGIILKAARHNLREIQAEHGAGGHIQTHLMALNEVIHGPQTAKEVDALAKRLMREAGITKLRKDAVLGIEAVFSLPLNHGLHGRKDTDYFNHCKRWFGRVMGGVMLSAVIHRDEANIHCHILMLPLIDGKMRGSEAFGSKAKIFARLDAFFDDVGASYGLQKPQPRLRAGDRDAAAESVLKTLTTTNDPAVKSTAWQAIRRSIEADPRPYALALGITLTAKPPKPMRTMAQIFTSTGKGPKVEKDERYKPIGFADKSRGFNGKETLRKSSPKDPAPKDQSLTCVGFHVQTRQRDSDLSPASFDPIFIQPLPSPTNEGCVFQNLLTIRSNPS